MSTMSKPRSVEKVCQVRDTEGKKEELSSSSSAAVNGSPSEVAPPQQKVQRGLVMTGCPQVCVDSRAVSDTKALAAELCRDFCKMGWVSAAGGSVSLKVHDDSVPRPAHLIVVAPSGVQNEKMVPEDMYVLSSDGFVLSTPLLKPYAHKASKCTDCTPLFLKYQPCSGRICPLYVLIDNSHASPLESRELTTKVYKMRDAGSVIHSHGMESCLVTNITSFSKEFRITHMEMIKGIQGHCYQDELVVPIIENAAYEGELLESLAEVIRAYPKTTAVLVRNHGVFIWGDSWVSAKTQAECYHYLFDAAIKLHQLGLDWSTPSHGPIRNMNGARGCSGNFNTVLKTGPSSLDYMIEPSQHRVLLDIEGTTTPVSFVTDVLLPYAHDNVEKHLTATYDSEETQNDINLLRSQD